MQVIVRPDAEEYVRTVVAECTGEVGGWGYCTRDDAGHFVIYKFVVLPQEVSSGSVDFDDDGQHEELQRAIDANEIDNLRVSWHSHGTMSTFYSNTDEEAIKKYKASGVPYLVSLIYNRKGEVKPRLDLFDSGTIDHITFETVDYKVHSEVDSAVAAQAKADVEERVRKSKPWSSSKGGTSTKKGGSTTSRRTSDTSEEALSRPKLWDKRRDHLQAWRKQHGALPKGMDIDAEGIIGLGTYDPEWDLTPVLELPHKKWLAYQNFYGFGDAGAVRWDKERGLYVVENGVGSNGDGDMDESTEIEILGVHDDD